MRRDIALRAMPKNLCWGFQAAYLICLIPFLNGAPSIISASWFDPSSFRHFRLALKINLKTMASAVLRDRQPFVFTVLRRTVAKVLSIGFVTGMQIAVPMFGPDSRISVYAASIRDRGTGSTMVRAGRSAR